MKKKVYITSYVAMGLFLGGFGLSSWAPQILSHSFIIFTSIIAVLLALLVGFVPQNAFSHSDFDVESSRKLSQYRVCLPLFLVQSLFILVTVLFFLTIEQQTRLNPRLEPMVSGEILSTIMSNQWLFWISPWILYSALGCLMAYYAWNLKRGFSFSSVTLPTHAKQPKAFFYYYLSAAIKTVIIFPIFFIMSLALIWICETVCIYLGWPSLFLFPMRSLFICALLLIGSYKFINKFNQWINQKHIPLGGILVLYLLMLSFFLLWMHGFAIWFFSGVESLDKTQGMKSIFLNLLSAEQKENRIMLLIWGWWIIWSSWMSSFVARMVIILRVRPILAFLICLILPLLVSVGLNFYEIDAETIKLYCNVLTEYFKNPVVSFMMTSILFLLIMMMWGSVQTLVDVERGAMFHMRQKQPRPLSKWLPIFLICFNCFLIAIFNAGWLPIQVIGTNGAGFMVTVIFAFLMRVILDVYRNGGQVLNFQNFSTLSNGGQVLNFQNFSTLRNFENSRLDPHIRN